MVAPDGAPAAPGDARASTPADFTRVVYPSLTRSGAAASPPATAPSGLAEPDGRAASDARAEARGHAAGYAAGLRQADAELAVRRAALEAEFAERVAGLEEATRASSAALAAAARALDARVAPVLADAEEALVAVAVDLAESVLGYELATSAAAGAVDEATLPVDDAAGDTPIASRRSERTGRTGRTARAALARALHGAETQVVASVRLHPADLAQLPPDVVAAAGVPLVADGSLARGDAEADLPHGIVDARLASAFARARAALLDAAALVAAPALATTPAPAPGIGG